MRLWVILLLIILADLQLISYIRLSFFDKKKKEVLFVCLCESLTENVTEMLNKTQLAELYRISLPTLRKRLREVGLYNKKKRLFSPFELVKIFEALGSPQKA